MINFLKIFDGIFNQKERILDDTFRRGAEHGEAEARRKIFAQRFEVTHGLTPEEEKEVCVFLAERNIEICYDVHKGGLRLRKAYKL